MGVLFIIMALCAIGICLIVIKIETIKNMFVKKSQNSLKKSKNDSNDIIIQNYKTYGIFDIPKHPTELNYIVSTLLKMKKNNPKTRHLNEYDVWFIQNVEKFYKYGLTLSIIEYYSYLSEAFIENLDKPWKNIELQKMLISVDEDGGMLNFNNLLCMYLKKWDLAPEIKRLIFQDERLKNVKRTYQLYR